MRTVLFAALGLALVAGTWLARDHWGSSRDQDVTEELKHLRTQIGRVAARADEDRRTSSLLLNRALTPRDAPATADVSNPASGVEQNDEAESSGGTSAAAAESEAARDEAHVAEESARNEAWFASEARDPAWANDAQANVQGGLRHSLGADSQLSSVECRESLCRAEVDHADERERQAFVTRFIHSDGQNWAGERMGLRHTRPDGKVVTRIYYAREGHTFH